ncbi:hypothetical protein OG976_19855 [Mycobacterium sp. NBC_00419]|uniref:hypothetical protein n=1 Tax=Mycobacterium sp. NBC_00419 TaxID=2975989 RepID=UPI002E1C7B10
MDSADVAPTSLNQLVAQYDKWRRIYSLLGELPRDEAVWDGTRLHLRAGYPQPGWTGYIIEPEGSGCSVSAVTSERRNEPIESLSGYFSSVDDAGKYIVLKTGESLRIRLRLDPIEWGWEDAGLDHRVRQVSLDRYVSKFELKDDPSTYIVLQVGGDQPESKLLTLTYNELDDLLLDGMPESVLSQI